MERESGLKSREGRHDGVQGRREDGMTKGESTRQRVAGWLNSSAGDGWVHGPVDLRGAVFVFVRDEGYKTGRRRPGEINIRRDL